MLSTNEIFTGTVRDISGAGNGIALDPAGKVFFIPGVWPGDVGRFRITGHRRNYGFAQLEELLEGCDSRVEPVCQHHGFSLGKCGNCPWQYVNYSAQIKAKSKQLCHHLEQAGLNSAGAIQPTWQAPQKFGYRNRAQLKTDGNVLGYVSPGGHTLASIEDCPILTDPNRKTLWQLLNTLPREDFRPTKTRMWNTIPIAEDIGIENIALNSKVPFRQANTVQNRRMKKWLSQRLATVQHRSTVLELFAGSGNFTEVISKGGFQRILAVEIDGIALTELKRQRLPNVQTLSCNLFSQKAFNQIAQILSEPEILVLNPPREGLKKSKDFIRQFPTLTEIIYISCDMASFARDLKNFCTHEFQIEEIQPLDPFPHTPHLEVLAHLAKSKYLPDDRSLRNADCLGLYDRYGKL